MMPGHSTVKIMGALSLLVLLGATLGFGQLTTANLTGLVTDPGGAVIPGASVVLTNTDTGEERQQSTGPEGRFTLSQLKPGNYELAVRIHRWIQDVRALRHSPASQPGR